MNVGWRRAVALALVLPLGTALALAGWTWFELARPWSGWTGEVVVIDLPRGLDAGSMLDRLGERGVLRSPRLLRAWLVLRGGAERLRAGEYRFDRPATPLEVLRRLQRGDVLLHAVTLPEGLVLAEVAARVAAAEIAGSEAVREAFSNPSPVRAWDPAAPDLEGYLFPDTYHFPRGETPQRIAQAMVARFREAIGDDYAGAAAAAGLTVREAVTLASLIEKETSVPEERGRISRVFHNRLERGMKLQCDPTVLYALERAGQSVSSLRLRHLEFDSPWNTYRVYGLPPGPICSPGADSLRAAVLPDPGEDLYFVASPDGGHRFSRDLASHREAVREWRSRPR